MQAPPQELPPKISPFLTGMAKGSLLGGEAIKLCSEDVHLILKCSQPIKLFILDISELINPL